MTIVSSTPAVTVSSLSFSYAGQDESAGVLYTDFDLRLECGCVTAIMGASGSGKSTLGKLVGSELAPASGAITWAEHLASELDHYYIDQDPKKVFFPRQTVRENIAYPMRKQKRRCGDIVTEVDKLLRAFKLESVADKYPLFISGGQQSRLALARVLAWRPKGIILDEYLSDLDVHTREVVISNIHSLVREGLTVILITHSIPEALKLADRCIILNGQPVSIAADIAIDLPHPRTEAMSGYRHAENALIDALRNGLL